jgi:hypothetical protein
VGFFRQSGLRYYGKAAPGAQTERQGDAGPVWYLLGRVPTPAALIPVFAGDYSSFPDLERFANARHTHSDAGTNP